MITLYWCPRTRAARVVWMLEELGVDYELAHINVRDPASKTDPGFLAASPMGKVPALQDGDAKLADSAAICLYLADRYPDAKLAPAIDDPARADYLYWMVYAPGAIEPAMAEKFGGWKPNKIASGWGDFNIMIETLAKGLESGPWLLGERFSAADVMVGSSVYFLKAFGILPDNAVLNDYVERALARPAYQRALKLEEQATA